MNISYTNELHAKYKERTRASVAAILPLAFARSKPASVVDVGCGHGVWLAACKNMGVSRISGIDGSYIDPAQMDIPPECFRAMDLNRPIPVGSTFDMAISLEVAEHLRPESTNDYLQFLTSLSPRILFAAAIPGQPGDAHVNERWPSFWIEEFKKRGYAALDFIRPQIWHAEEVILCYRQNILFFAKEELCARGAEYDGLPRANCLHLVDEGILQELLGVRESLKRCGRHVANSLTPGRG